jgi:hypothetical protein
MMRRIFLAALCFAFLVVPVMAAIVTPNEFCGFCY